MKVLFLCHRVPSPPDRGDRITTYHLLHHLLAQGAEVRVGCLAENAADVEAAAGLAKSVTDICAPKITRPIRKLLSLRALCTGQAMTMPFFHSYRLYRTVRRWLRESPPDVIFVYSSSMAQYAMGSSDSLRLMHFAELDSDKWLQYAEHSGPLGRWIYGREARLLLQFETRIARLFDHSLVVSQVEKDLFEAKISGVTPLVLPNGVDIQHFASDNGTKRHPHTLIFTGVMEYQPNVEAIQWFVRECWPQIRQRFADARLLVVGSRPSSSMLELDGKQGITVTGRVPVTPPYFNQATVAIAPIHLGRGVQNKVLEAMSMGLPVVTSSQAAQGLGPVPADTLCVVDSPADTTAAICGFWDSPQKARDMGERAAAFIRQNFTWERIYKQFDGMIRQGKD